MPSALVLLKITLVVVLGIGVYRVVLRTLRFFAQTRHLPAPLVVPLQRLLRTVVITLVILVALPQAGVQVTGLWAGVLTLAAMVAGGFVALSSVVSNFLCTVFLVMLNPFRPGDSIEIVETSGAPGLRGPVVDLTLFHTSVQLEDDAVGRVAHVPNTLFFQKPIRRQRPPTPSPAVRHE